MGCPQQSAIGIEKWAFTEPFPCLTTAHSKESQASTPSSVTYRCYFVRSYCLAILPRKRPVLFVELHRQSALVLAFIFFLWDQILCRHNRRHKPKTIDNDLSQFETTFTYNGWLQRIIDIYVIHSAKFCYYRQGRAGRTLGILHDFRKIQQIITTECSSKKKGQFQWIQKQIRDWSTIPGRTEASFIFKQRLSWFRGRFSTMLLILRKYSIRRNSQTLADQTTLD